jgi:hypothetical protein
MRRDDFGLHGGSFEFGLFCQANQYFETVRDVASKGARVALVFEHIGEKFGQDLDLDESSGERVVGVRAENVVQKLGFRRFVSGDTRRDAMSSIWWDV